VKFSSLLPHYKEKLEELVWKICCSETQINSARGNIIKLPMNCKIVYILYVWYTYSTYCSSSMKHTAHFGE
jgi:hypothetical protein